MSLRFREIPTWVWSLSRQERELLQALVVAYPRALTDAYLDQVVVHHEHAAERGVNVIPVIVSRVRHKLPMGGIERVKHVGYRLSAEAAGFL